MLTLEALRFKTNLCARAQEHSPRENTEQQIQNSNENPIAKIPSFKLEAVDQLHPDFAPSDILIRKVEEFSVRKVKRKRPSSSRTPPPPPRAWPREPWFWAPTVPASCPGCFDQLPPYVGCPFGSSRKLDLFRHVFGLTNFIDKALSDSFGSAANNSHLAAHLAKVDSP